MTNPVLDAEREEAKLIKELASELKWPVARVGEICRVLRSIWRWENKWRWTGNKYEERNDR